jgi:hypothetical protein
VYLELKNDSFHRYLQSEKFTQFVYKEGEKFMQSIAVDLKQVERERFQPSDFSQARVTEDDFKFMIYLNESISDWVTLRATKKNEREKDYYSYISREKFLIDNEPLSASKLTGNLNFSAQEALYSLLDRECSYKWEPFTTFYKQVGYDDSGDYAVSQSYNELSLVPLMKKRYCCGITSLVYDSERRCYIWLCKTTTGFSHEEHQQTKNAIRTTSIAAYSIFPLSENKCRYTVISFAKASDFIFKIISKKMCKSMQSGWTDLCYMRKERFNHAKPVDHSRNLDTLDHFMEKFLPDENSTKTWNIEKTRS